MNADSICRNSVTSLRTFTIPANRRIALTSAPAILTAARTVQRGVSIVLTCRAIAHCPAHCRHAGGRSERIPLFPMAGMLQVMLGLGLVLALMAGLAWLLRRFGGMQQGAAGAIKIIGGSAVGQRERVVVVEVGDTGSWSVSHPAM